MPPIPGDGRRVTKSIMANEGKNRYTIGLDYGSLSCRGVIVNVENGRILAERAMEYPHGVMEALPAGGAPLGEGWYLQDPEDFTRVLARNRCLACWRKAKCRPGKSSGSAWISPPAP